LDCCTLGSSLAQRRCTWQCVQVRAIDSQKVELDQSARIQLESLQKQYELQASTANRQ